MVLAIVTLIAALALVAALLWTTEMWMRTLRKLMLAERQRDEAIHLAAELIDRQTDEVVERLERGLRVDLKRVGLH